VGRVVGSAGHSLQGSNVGGSHKSQQSGYESFGVQNQGARDLGRRRSHRRVGGTGFYEDYFANEEVSVTRSRDVEMNCRAPRS